MYSNRINPIAIAREKDDAGFQLEAKVNLQVYASKKSETCFYLGV